jgi:formylglycine-generating enzyme required for sulfatase activity
MSVGAEPPAGTNANSGSATSEGASSQGATTKAVIYDKWPFDAKEAQKRQEETAKALDMPKEITLDIDKKMKMKMELIPAGVFIMGSPRGVTHGWLTPEHEVVISKPFYMGITHVTKGQFEVFVKDTGFRTDSEAKGLAWTWTGNGFGKVKGASWLKPGFEQKTTTRWSA